MAKKKVTYSKNFDKVKSYYDLYVETDGARGWSKEKVHNAVTHPVSDPWITEAEYKEITGEDYEP